jgi:hypothetical protein
VDEVLMLHCGHQRHRTSFGGRDLGDAPLVRTLHIGVDERDGERLDALGAETAELGAAPPSLF